MTLDLQDQEEGGEEKGVRLLPLARFTLQPPGKLGASEEVQLIGVRAPVLADVFPLTKAETTVCPYKHALHMRVSHDRPSL